MIGKFHTKNVVEWVEIEQRIHKFHPPIHITVHNTYTYRHTHIPYMYQSIHNVFRIHLVNITIYTLIFCNFYSIKQILRTNIFVMSEKIVWITIQNPCGSVYIDQLRIYLVHVWYIFCVLFTTKHNLLVDANI